MKKFTYFLIGAALLLSLPEASARLRSLSEWSGNMPSGAVSTSYDGYTANEADGAPGLITAPLTAEQYCPKVCPGFKTEIEDCDAGYELKNCPDADCAKYVKCTVIICEDGYDTSFKDCPISVQDDNYHCTKCIE